MQTYNLNCLKGHHYNVCIGIIEFNIQLLYSKIMFSAADTLNKMEYYILMIKYVRKCSPRTSNLVVIHIRVVHTHTTLYHPLQQHYAALKYHDM